MCLGFTFHRRINRPAGERWFSAMWEGAQFLLPSSAHCHFVVAGSMLPKPISFLKNFLRPASSHCSAALESGGLSPGWWFSNLTLPQPHLDTLFNRRLVDPAPVCTSVPLERSLRISFLTSPQVKLMMLGQRPHSENH